CGRRIEDLRDRSLGDTLRRWRHDLSPPLGKFRPRTRGTRERVRSPKACVESGRNSSGLSAGRARDAGASLYAPDLPFPENRAHPTTTLRDPDVDKTIKNDKPTLHLTFNRVKPLSGPP